MRNEQHIELNLTNSEKSQMVLKAAWDPALVHERRPACFGERATRCQTRDGQSHVNMNYNKAQLHSAFIVIM